MRCFCLCGPDTSYLRIVLSCFRFLLPLFKVRSTAARSYVRSISFDSLSLSPIAGQTRRRSDITRLHSTKHRMQQPTRRCSSPNQHTESSPKGRFNTHLSRILFEEVVPSATSFLQSKGFTYMSVKQQQKKGSNSTKENVPRTQIGESTTRRKKQNNTFGSHHAPGRAHNKQIIRFGVSHAFHPFHQGFCTPV